MEKKRVYLRRAKAIPPVTPGHFSSRFITNLPSAKDNRFVKFVGRRAQVVDDLRSFKELEENPHFAVVKALGIGELLGQKEDKAGCKVDKAALERNLKDLGCLTMVVFQNHKDDHVNQTSDEHLSQIAVGFERWKELGKTPFDQVIELVFVHDGILSADTDDAGWSETHLSPSRRRFIRALCGVTCPSIVGSGLTVSRKALNDAVDNTHLALRFFDKRGPAIV
ncbi:hypothetical protein IAT38_004732 [Cryptococcus sp. DSM 104549]